MKFSVTKEKLLEALQQVQNVVSTRTTLPILSNVLLQANETELHLTTTDLDVGVRGTCEAHVDKAGSTTLPARRVFNIIRELPSSEIQIDVDLNFARWQFADDVENTPRGQGSGSCLVHVCFASAAYANVQIRGC